jgi:hypothetical protein
MNSFCAMASSFAASTLWVHALQKDVTARWSHGLG